MNKDRNKFWRCWLWIYLVCVAVPLWAIIAFQVKIDPFDVWNTPPEYGYNQIKIHLNDYDRVYKPYQYAQKQPKVVFLGNSRVKWGLPPAWPSYDEGEVYNFGSNAFRISEMELYIDFILRTHTPELVVLGVGSLQFQEVNKHDPKPIKERLDTIALSPMAALLNKVKETCLSVDMVSRSFDTIEASKKRPQRDPIIHEGWRTDDFGFHNPSIQRYVKSMWMYTHGYRHMTLDDAQLEAFGRIIEKLEQNDVAYHVFFMPTPADLQLTTFRREGKWDQVLKIKESILEHTEFMDFSDINSITANRRSYVDASHFRTAVGAMIIHRLSGRRLDDYGHHQAPSGFGIRITKANFNNQMRSMYERLGAFEEKNRDFAVQLERHIHNKKAFQDMLRKTVKR